MAAQTINLLEETAHYYHKYLTTDPEKTHYIFKKGRGVGASTFLAILSILRALRHPHYDQMCISFDEKKIKTKIFADYMFALDILHIPKQLYTAKCSEVGEKYIIIHTKWGDNKIFFENGKGKSESFKGKKPSPGNKWGMIRFYELTYFYGWDSIELSNTIATFVRDAYSSIDLDKVEQYCKEHNHIFMRDEKWVKDQQWYIENYDKFLTKGFAIYYEYNTPTPSLTSGLWVIDWERTVKDKPNYEFIFNNYLDMTPQEQLKFLKEEALIEIQNLKDINPSEYENIYLGMEGYTGLITYLNLTEDNFGRFEDFHPDVITVGFDEGRVDATVMVCTAWQGILTMGRDLKAEVGVHYYYHCNGKKLYFIDDEQKEFNKKEFDEYVNDMVDFLNKVHQTYPRARIMIQMDEAGIGQAFYDRLWRSVPQQWACLIGNWQKAEQTDNIDLINRMCGAKCIKFVRRKIWTAFRNQVYDERKYRENKERVRVDNPAIKSLDMDTINAVEYSITDVIRKVVNQRLFFNKGKKI